MVDEQRSGENHVRDRTSETVVKKDGRGWVMNKGRQNRKVSKRGREIDGCREETVEREKRAALYLCVNVCAYVCTCIINDNNCVNICL